MKDPLTYTSAGVAYESEASCIDTTLIIGTPVAEPKGALGYWPQYDRLSPGQRANYLTWLATGRKSPLEDIGYAFIYVYGLERRLLVDKSDAQPIVEESLRLLKAYPDSESLRSYLTSLVGYEIALRGIQKLTDSWHKRIFQETIDSYDEDFLAIALAWLFLRQKPLPGAIAFRAAANDPRSPRSVVSKRMPQEFRALFVKKFEAKYGEGFALRASKKDRRIEHRPASPSLLAMFRSSAMPAVHVPDVLGIQSQFKVLVEIWKECIADLKAVSTKVAKGMDITSREAYEALPQELKSEYDHPDRQHWQAIVDSQGRDDGTAIVPVSILAEMRDIARRPKLTLKQSMDLARGAREVGFVLVPDPWTIQRPYVWREPVAVLPFDGHEDLAADHSYLAAALMLELGIAMAAADGKIGKSEVVHVSLALRSQFRLSQAQARRLEAFRRILIRTPPSLTGIGKRIQRILSKEQREAVGHFLLGVALSDGTLAKDERGALKAIYRSMGLDPNEVDELITGLTTPEDAPVVVQQRSAPDREGESIPSAPPPREETTFSINMDLVAQITRESLAVADMIGRAMGELTDSEPESTVSTPSTGALSSQPAAHTVADTKYEGLPSRYHAILDQLLTQEVWPRENLESLLRRHDVMPASTLDEINSWADDRLGDYLIEGEDPYRIQRVLVEERL